MQETWFNLQARLNKLEEMMEKVCTWCVIDCRIERIVRIPQVRSDSGQ